MKKGRRIKYWYLKASDKDGYHTVVYYAYVRKCDMIIYVSNKNSMFISYEIGLLVKNFRKTITLMTRFNEKKKKTKVALGYKL
jgi:hypothetical protein